MDPKTRELFREELIRILAAIGSPGAKAAYLKVGLRAAGFEPADREIDDELDYLAGKGLVTAAEKLISPENRRWKITAAGRDFAAQNGLG